MEATQGIDWKCSMIGKYYIGASDDVMPIMAQPEIVEWLVLCYNVGMRCPNRNLGNE
jgi:hypothetical protein